MRDRWRMKTLRLFSTLLVAGIAFSAGERTVSASLGGFYNGIKQFSELPQEVNELKEGYNHTLQELEQARNDVKQFQEQNAELAEQNRKLTEMVLELQQAEMARKQNAERIKTVVLTAIGLALGYFVLIRALRFGMRRTNRYRR
ncbi:MULTISPECIES: hypothetical protein [Paenibacillus]|uniref:DUF3450 family protein n=1 Tax=Paenibacillus campinasensis TaxID=66347 RepID=A0A268EDI4_9BACL|nr:MULTISPECIES: hypothetical protein [Paenibacillus]PAD71183.1 hypothetical protein CHH67_25505 [Paenibacillus campinasensis]PAK49716.1 hypothetical protein CHH75_20210 [Paenibacillus sp. 7541]